MLKLEILQKTKNQNIRVGGLVKENSIKKIDSLTTEFVITDLAQELKIELSKTREENKENQREVFKLMNEVKSILNKETGLTSWIRTLRK